MNKEFLDDTYFLQTKLARELYFRYAANMPIVDFHCHLEAQEIYEDKPFQSLYELWLKYDHYKWRLMRLSKISEEFVTGEKEPYEKFLAYAKSLSGAVNNPLYLWSHLELKKYFKITLPITPQTAPRIWNEVSEKLKQTKLSPRKCLEMSKVETVFTTDDVMSKLEYHKLLKEQNYKVKVLPTFRGDRAIHIDQTLLSQLQEKYNIKIDNLEEYLSSIKKRIDYFHDMGAKASDFAMEDMSSNIISKTTAQQIFQTVLQNKTTPKQKKDLTVYILFELAKYLYEKGMALQLHIGASRNKNSLMYDKLGKDTGYDSASYNEFLNGLGDLLNGLKKINKLPNTIIYNINPAFNQPIATLCGCFSDSKSSVQLGPAWWFLDYKQGIVEQLTAFSSCMNLSQFVGMLTDSRSFISYPRHDYFRRILCNFIANRINDGEFFFDSSNLQKMIKDICYYNAREFFGL